jgi:deoxyribodipyrimidine photo-lyase
MIKILDGSIPSCSLTYFPTLQDLGYTEDEIQEAQKTDPRGVMKFEGGESFALRRVQDYIWDKDLLKIYFDTRNGMIGADYSSKFSPWLAHGCLSPRFVAKECKRYEKERSIVNKSTYWLVFELLWRDFFKFFALKQGNKIFFLEGTLGELARGTHPNSRRWGLDKKALKAWKEGKTGYPLVDANMRELAATGFMSNRGRQNVASFLAIDMNIDWRYGADHFEMLLLDYDVYSNWGNWCSAAGMTGGRLNRFNIVKQSKDYDAQGDYVRHWCPELSSLPNALVHEPWKMNKEQQAQYGLTLGIDYPNPIVAPTVSNPYRNDQDDDRKKNSSSKGPSHRGKGQRRDMKSLKEGNYDFF